MQTLHNRTGRAHAAGVNNRKSRKKKQWKQFVEIETGVWVRCKVGHVLFLDFKILSHFNKASKRKGHSKKERFENPGKAWVRDRWLKVAVTPAHKSGRWSCPACQRHGHLHDRHLKCIHDYFLQATAVRPLPSGHQFVFIDTTHVISATCALIKCTINLSIVLVDIDIQRDMINNKWDQG